MRMVPLLLALTSTLAFAQLGRTDYYQTAPQPRWTFGFAKVQPSFSISVAGVKDGRTSQVDSDADLGLGRHGTPLGLFTEYQGDSQTFAFSYDSATYTGDRVLSRDISLDGVAYAAGTPLQTSAKLKVMEGMWTYKWVRRADAYIGLDLGAQLLQTDLSAQSPAGPQAASPSILLPQIGLTGWSSGAGGLLESRVYVRYLAYKGASLTRYGFDGRAYLYPSFGLRAFYEDSRLRIPRGSLQQDLDIHADRRVTGVGLVIRF